MVRAEADSLCGDFNILTGCLEKLLRFEAAAKADTQKREDEAVIERKKWDHLAETTKMQKEADEKASKTAAAEYLAGPQAEQCPFDGLLGPTQGHSPDKAAGQAGATAKAFQDQQLQALTPTMPVWQDDMLQPAQQQPQPKQIPKMPIWQDDLVPTAKPVTTPLAGPPPKGGSGTPAKAPQPQTLGPQPMDTTNNPKAAPAAKAASTPAAVVDSCRKWANGAKNAAKAAAVAGSNPTSDNQADAPVANLRGDGTVNDRPKFKVRTAEEISDDCLAGTVT